MRGRNERGSRFATSLDASGNVQTFFVNRNGYEMTPGQCESISCQAVTRIFYPGGASRIEENASRNLERLLRTADDHDLLGVAVQRSRRSQMAGDRFPESLEADQIAVVK